MLTIARKHLVAILAVLATVSLPYGASAGGSRHGHGNHGHGGYHGHHHGGHHSGYHGHRHYSGYGYGGYYGGYYPFGYHGRGYYGRGYYGAYPYGYYPGYYGYYGGWAPVALAGGLAAGVAIAQASRPYDDQFAYADGAAPANGGSESCAVVRRLKDIDGRSVRVAATICVDQGGNAYVVQGSEFVLDR